MGNMGFDFGLPLSDGSSRLCKRKFRWLFKIEGISAQGIHSLPPSKSARPAVSFKEMEAKHLTENIFFPQKPEWKPVSLVLYDVKRNLHPLFEWLKLLYDPSKGSWGNIVDSSFMKTADLELYDATGNIIEKWVYEQVYPQAMDFGELDMANSEVVTCELTLRYARAYIQQQS